MTVSRHTLIHHARRSATALFLGYFVLVLSGIPMVTFLCGSQRTVCTMDGCEGASDMASGPAVSGPDCCVAKVTTSDLTQAIVQTGMHMVLATVPFLADISPGTQQAALYAPAADTGPPHGIPLFLQYSSLLI